MQSHTEALFQVQTWSDGSQINKFLHCNAAVKVIRHRLSSTQTLRLTLWLFALTLFFAMGRVLWYSIRPHAGVHTIFRSLAFQIRTGCAETLLTYCRTRCTVSYRHVAIRTTAQCAVLGLGVVVLFIKPVVCVMRYFYLSVPLTFSMPDVPRMRLSVCNIWINVRHGVFRVTVRRCKEMPYPLGHCVWGAAVIYAQFSNKHWKQYNSVQK